MTRKIHVHLIDDLDASEASETLRFEVDGRTYEIDLSSRNAQMFRAEIAPYVEHARRVATQGGRRGRGGGGRSGAGPGRPRGGDLAAPQSSALPSGGHAADPADSETTIPDYAGGLPSRADLGTGMFDGSPEGPDSGDEERAPS